MKFASRYRNYKVWLKPSYYRLDALGNRVFQQGVFAQFIDGFFESDDKEVIELLKKSKSYGIDFWSMDEPTQPNKEAKEEEEKKEALKETTVTDCPKCGKSFANLAGLKSHMRIVHQA